MTQFDLVLAQVEIVLRWLVFQGYEAREMGEYPTPSQAVQGFQLPPCTALSGNREAEEKNMSWFDLVMVQVEIVLR